MVPETNFFELVYEPINARYDGDDQLDSLGEYLNHFDPKVLHRTFERGMRNAIASYSAVMSASTLDACERTVHVSRSLCDEMYLVWERMEEYDRNGMLDGAAAGIFSGESATGAAIGSVLAPGIGTIIGGAIGGFLAGSKIDKQFGRDMEAFGELWAGYFEQLEMKLEALVEPRLLGDLDAYYVQLESYGDEDQTLMTVGSSDSGGSANIVIAALILALGMIVTALILV